ncbi:hypothetical protein [Streptomyces sp. NPDC059597]|uniref:hypothetical protein n=1 Tax=Streptomyces sp. NPDC059597 TaxID=3346879 RepID=UPI0036A72CC9
MAHTEPTDDGVPDGLLGWCPVANMSRETVRGEGGPDIQHGTKHFRAGTLLWIPPVRWDPGHQRWRAVGRHRGNGGRYVNMVVRADDLENFRVKGVYSEALVRGLNGHGHDPAAPRTMQDPWTLERAQKWADARNHRGERAFFVDGNRRVLPGVSVPDPPPAEFEVDGETLYLVSHGQWGVQYSRRPRPVERLPGS